MYFWIDAPIYISGYIRRPSDAPICTATYFGILKNVPLYMSYVPFSVLHTLEERLPSGAPKEEFGRIIFEQKSSLRDCTKVKSTPSAAARGGEALRRNVWRPVYIRLSLQLSLTLACIKALSKTLPNIHGSSHVPVPRLTSTSSCRRR